jgi:ABC-2 type transport system permease protein
MRVFLEMDVLEGALGPLRLLRLLWLGPLWRGLRLQSLSEWVRLLAFLLVGFFFVVTLYSIFRPVTAFLWLQPELGPVLSARVLSLVFSLLFILMFFSGLLAFLGRLVFAEDAAWFAATPVSPRVYYSLRLWQSFVATAWMLVPVWFPYLWALRRALGASWLFVAWGCLAPWPLAALATVLAAAALSLLLRVFSPARLRGVLLAVAVAVGLAALLGLRLARPERLADPETALTVARYLASLDRLEPLWWPATWVSRSVLAQASSPRLALAWGLLSLAVVVLAWRLCVVCFGQRSWELWWRGQESGLQSPGGGGKAFLNARGGLGRVLVEREAVALWRGRGQRLQAILVLSLIALFIFSLDRLPLDNDVGLRDMLYGPVSLLVQVILLAVAARFVFPAGSLDRTGAWMLFSAPVSAWRHLQARILFSLGYLLPLSLLLSGAVAWVLKPSPLPAAVQIFNALATPVLLACLGTGLGVAWARRDVSQPEDFISSPAGVLAMALAFLVLLAQSGLSTLFSLALGQVLRRGRGELRAAEPVLFFLPLLWLTLVVLATGLPLRAALRRLQEQE